MPVQRFAQVLGAVYVLVGLLGFAFTGFANFAGTSDDKLLLFGVNPLHNIVHIAVGALWLASSRTEASARAVSTLIGAVYLVVGVLGLFINGSSGPEHPEHQPARQRTAPGERRARPVLRAGRAPDGRASGL